jgi:hypothetical protein
MLWYGMLLFYRVIIHLRRFALTYALCVEKQAFG